MDESETSYDTASQEEKKEPKNTCCFICLSEPIEDPFVLPNCGHAFCFGCLQDWQGFANSKIRFHSGNNNQSRESKQPKCPACRAEAPDIVRSVHETALLYAARSHNKDLSDDEQRKYKELALEELNKVDTSSAMDARQKIQTLFTRAEILQQLNRPEEAFQALEEVEILHQEGTKNRNEMLAMLDELQVASDEGRIADAEGIHERMEAYSEGGRNIASLGDACDLYLSMAECKAEMGDYRGARDIHKFKLLSILDGSSTPPQQRKMLMGMSKCAYHLGNYKLAIEFGESAIGMNRYFPQIHKYVALSQKASGDLSAAVRTMGRAVNYETPWDEANRKVVLAMYRELKNEAEEISGGEASTIATAIWNGLWDFLSTVSLKRSNRVSPQIS